MCFINDLPASPVWSCHQSHSFRVGVFCDAPSTCRVCLSFVGAACTLSGQPICMELLVEGQQYFQFTNLVPQCANAGNQQVTMRVQLTCQDGTNQTRTVIVQLNC